MQDREKFVRAHRHVAEIKGFYVHAAAFVGVVLILLALNAASGDDWWVQWVFFGWGIGVVAHALAVFGRTPSFVSRWEKRKLRQMLQN